LVVDSNPQHDLWADWQYMAKRGLWPGFDVLMHDPVDEQGNITAPIDLSSQRHRQFIIYDTSQYVQILTTRWAWTHCHVMIVPITPDTAELRNVRLGEQIYRGMPEPRGPLIFMPCKARVLRNSMTQRRMQDFLAISARHGCVVPEFPQEYQIPESELMGIQECRWIYAETHFNGVLKRVPDEFIKKVDLTFAWIRHAIQNHYGPFPVPRLREINLMAGRDAILSELKSELESRQRESAMVQV
jgi:hypothetical protein